MSVEFNNHYMKGRISGAEMKLKFIAELYLLQSSIRDTLMFSILHYMRLQVFSHSVN